MAATAEEWSHRNRGMSILGVSHLSLLTEQTFDRFRSRAPSLSLGIMQGKRRASMMNNVVFSTMQTARSATHIAKLKETLLKPVGLILVDETHMLPTTSYETIQGYFPDAQLIGYTATPFRQKKIMTNCFDKISFSISLAELIAAGYLVAPEVHAFSRDGMEDLDVIANVMGLYQTREAGRPAIAYLKTIDEAKLLRNAFESVGVVSRCVTSDVSPDQRTEIFASFRAGRIQVLTTVDVLTAGFDASLVECIFMPHGTKSPTQYIQRIGRGLRQHPGKTSCRVYIYGDAPSVSNHAFEKLTRTVLLAGSSKSESATFREDLDNTFHTKGSEIYEWTKSVVDAVTRFEKLGMPHFAALLDQKRFPEQFMRSIQELLKRLPKKKTKLPHGEKPASEAQQSVLFNAGFGSEICGQLSKNEAHVMISALFNKKNGTSSTEHFTVPEGSHAGKHVSELPHAYRSLVKKRFPDSPVAALITEWESRRKHA